jgi:hypothetical protein
VQIRLLVLGSALSVALGCSDAASHADAGSPPLKGANSDAAALDAGDMRPQRSFADYTDGRYCEVLVAHPRSSGGLVADVWNSLPFGSCPQEQWQMLDVAQIKADFPDAALVLLNGPRYFLMQEFYQDAALVTPEVHSFGAIQMVLGATVDVDPSQSQPYTEHHVVRETTFRFKAGKRIFEIQTASGSTFIMQSFSRSVDADLSFEALPALGDRLTLPDGWRFDSRIIDADLDVSAYGVATVIQDDLQNTYQLLEEPPRP